MSYRKKLIEVAMPLEAINAAAVHEKAVRVGHPANLHLWWARRPLAAARAVLFAQVVDDPSSWPEYFPTRKEQDEERERLFGLIAELVQWENQENTVLLGHARGEIARSMARAMVARKEATSSARTILDGTATPAAIAKFIHHSAPVVYDPFAGGGSIPIEAQRLGLDVLAADLNPIPVLLNRVGIDFLRRFHLNGPIHETQVVGRLGGGPSTNSIASDLRHYARLLRDQARKRIGKFYPTVKVDEGDSRTVVAWIWARTVPSPDPALGGAHVPLISSFWLSKKKGKEAWMDPVIQRHQWHMVVRRGKPFDRALTQAGTKTGRGDFRCLITGVPIPANYIRSQGQKGNINQRLIAIAAVGKDGRGRSYHTPSPDHERIATSIPASSDWLDTALPDQALGFRVQNYGITHHRQMFTARQLLALDTFADCIPEVVERVELDARRSGMQRGVSLSTGGTDALAYAETIGTLLSMAVSKTANRSTSLGPWMLSVECPDHLFKRSAISMAFDFAEANVLDGPSGSFLSMADNTARGVEALACPTVKPASASQSDAMMPQGYPQGCLISTDPPYYDNIPYADLSDFFYVWLRRCLRKIQPDLFRTVLTPKSTELIAEPFRHGGKEAAETFFMNGITMAVDHMATAASRQFPITIYYAFKQTETTAGATSSTGWETFLDGLISAGIEVLATWPIRTERQARARAMKSNALASSVVLVCRPRASDAVLVRRNQFRRLLRRELPGALRALEKSNIAPVDMAQATVGPGMAIYSRHAGVLEADDSPMSVKAALQLINQVIDEIRGEEDSELDADTRFAVTWFDSYGLDSGPYGEAEVLAKARAVSVDGVAEAGICTSGGGRVQLIERSQLPPTWHPAHDARPTVWEATQHLIKRLDESGEHEAAALMGQIDKNSILGSRVEAVRLLAYRLYTICERKGWAEEAGAYNRLVVAWPELVRLSADTPPPADAQTEIF